MIYPKPDRSDQIPNLEKGEGIDVIDIGWNEGFLSDGRPYRVECWAQDQITMLTFFLTTNGIENYSDSMLKQLLIKEGLIKEFLTNAVVSAMPFTDASNNEMWSINIVVGNEEEVMIRDGIILLPYKKLTQIANWDTVEKYATEIFIYRALNEDLEWAKSVWEALMNTSLVQFSSQPEFYRAIVRLFCLGELYWIYVNMAHDENRDIADMYYDWIEEADLDDGVFLNMCCIEEMEEIDEDYSLKRELLTECVDKLISEQYADLVNALVNKFGDEDELVSCMYNALGSINTTESNIKIMEWKRNQFSRKI